MMKVGGSNKRAKIHKGNNKVLGDKIFKIIALSAALIIIVILLAILLKLFDDSSLSIHKFGLGFLWNNKWNPVTGEYGALSSVFGTLVSTAIALLIAVPLSLAIAVFLAEIAPPVISKPVSYAIELLAAIPSIIYGMWGLFVFAPVMADHVNPFIEKYLGFIPLFRESEYGGGIGMLTAGIILALMVLPFISSVMRDVFNMVPSVVKESAYGMGSTTWETTRKVTIRYGIKGLIGACFLGLGRAIGETMAVTFVIGNNHKISESLFSPGNSIASTLANEFAEAAEPLYLSALIQLGLILFLLTFIIQAIAQLWLGRLSKSMGKGL